MTSDNPILEARNLTSILGGDGGFLRPRRRAVRAVDEVSFAVRSGDTLGIVGESGCGKTTLGRTLLGVQRETSGEILVDGKRVDSLPPRRARAVRRAIQYLHQDAGGSLDPWWSVGGSLAEAQRLAGRKQEIGDNIQRLLGAVGLDPSARNLYPHQLSGGQARRVALARLLCLEPRIVILDEPTAGLDLSVQATVLRLLAETKRSFGLAMLFISHDIGVVRLMCEHVLVMYRGAVVEEGPTADLMINQRHPYTRALVAATPRLAARVPKRADIDEPPPLARDISGCGFHPRCAHAMDLCKVERPRLERAGTVARVACHRWRELARPRDGVQDTPAKMRDEGRPT